MHTDDVTMKRAWDRAFGVTFLKDIKKEVLVLMEDELQEWSWPWLEHNKKTERTRQECAEAQRVRGEEYTRMVDIPCLRDWYEYKAARDRKSEELLHKGEAAMYFWKCELHAGGLKKFGRCEARWLEFISVDRSCKIRAWKAWRTWLDKRKRATKRKATYIESSTSDP